MIERNRPEPMLDFEISATAADRVSEEAKRLRSLDRHTAAEIKGYALDVPAAA